MEAARYWAAPTPDSSKDADLEEAFRAFGIDESLADGLDEGPSHFEVWPDNWDTVLVFLRIQTQWRKEITMSGQLIWHGLRYGDVAIAIRLLGYGRKRQEIFEGLLEMEREALPILNQVKK